MSKLDAEKKRETLYKSFKVNPIAISYEFQEYVDFGNQKSKVTPFDLTVYEPENKKEDKEYTAEELMAQGTKLMDAVLYQYVRLKKGFVFAQSPKEIHTIKPSEIGEALFCVYHCLLTKGSIPTGGQEKIPEFIRDIFKNPETSNVYSKMIASFDINLLDTDWIKRVKLYGVTLNFKHRLSFGVLGHEILDILRLFEPKNIETSNYHNAYYTSLKFACKGPFWNIYHPKSSRDNWNTFSNSEPALTDMIYHIYSNDQVKHMKDCGFLSNTYPLTHARKIIEDEFNGYNDFIFNDKMLDKPDDSVLESKVTYPLYLYEFLDKESIGSRKEAYISFRL
ncbi:hypothetical protein G6F56_009477 [Rhizopus delemar]|uniref:Uncharacterized protein n=1 Tax=Rhizopus stolonifer TaxID=4846 RepID=A0A367IM33_RHIST|nr:hypothetical protein G6F56_009477 [Rhizopus delemar]RCH78561.1 hypothetical protein CU098_005158 [Rhizopus stolonifer]